MKTWLKKVIIWLNQAGNAPFGKMTVRDVLHGLYMAIGSAIGAQIVQTLGAGQPISFHTLKYTALSAGLTAIFYYLKQLGTNEKGTFGPITNVE